MQGRTIDWKAIHVRLAAAEASVRDGSLQDPKEVRRILEARARAAAIPPAAPDESERLEALVFSLGQESYAVEARFVTEVCALRSLTQVPCTPAVIAGVMNLRGRILAILDLRRFFELPPKGLTELNRIIVIGDGENELGLLADAIVEVQQVPLAQLQEGLPTLGGIRERFIRGVNANMLAVLDGGLLLADASLKVSGQPVR
ncbi:MAG: chemotaxis protein CheW [Firmicutes bacterium]|nr:chemotaxis protein CheW [Bacillota bacterium]